MENILGSRIKRLRENRGLSQKQLAAELEISNVQLSRYESGNRKPDPDTIASFANYFDVSADYLLGIASSVSDPQAEYVSEQEQLLLQTLKRHPQLEHVLYQLLQSPDKKRNRFIELWRLFNEQN
ncbi:MAG TPA: helix-turn-helix transcriptional regulator [Bacillales bacterium]|nr:helix-turn-helix transcriptional regulator [Bacillales bacterium]